MEEICENCKYSVEIYKDENFDSEIAQTFVLCHRYPPREQTIPKSKKIVQLRYAWPLVGKKEWCGEYKPKHKE